MTDKDKRRLFREFYYPPRISASGNYYPRYRPSRRKSQSHIESKILTQTLT